MTHQDWASRTEFAMLLRVLRRCFNVTNMQLERWLREVRASVPVAKGRPSAESLAHLGLLAQSWQAHIKLGPPRVLMSLGAIMSQTIASGAITPCFARFLALRPAVSTSSL